MSLNHITIMGRFTRDPEYKTTGSGISVVNFSLAVDRDFTGKDGGEKETDFIDCVAWRKTAEFITKYMRKGSMAVVSGRLQVRSWTDNDGNRRRASEVVVDNIYFADSKRNTGDSHSEAPSFAPAGMETTQTVSPDFAMLDDADPQLPF